MSARKILPLLVLAAAVATLSARASETSQPIARISIGGGLTGYGTVVSIQEDGLVTAANYMRIPRHDVSQTVLAKLSKDTVAKLQEKIEKIEASELVTEHPESPGCMDAPTTTISVFQKGQAEGLRLKSISACKKYERKDYSYEAQAMISTLEGLMALQRLQN